MLQGCYKDATKARHEAAAADTKAVAGSNKLTNDDDI
jgi:hypothetical protein